VGVSGYDMTLLLQRPQEVMRETKFIGQTVESGDKLNPYGNVLLDGKKWASTVVTDSLVPFYGIEIEQGQKLTIVAVATQLLVVYTDFLVPGLWKRSLQLAQNNFVPIVTGVGIVGPAE
ncbi:MAG: hypothetical protein GTN99_00380, partial [Candidatus Dadabacteria bacterium]|nr:hypothetical protein [Candidatus Dadabacteria bacterium]